MEQGDRCLFQAVGSCSGGWARAPGKPTVHSEGSTRFLPKCWPVPPGFQFLERQNKWVACTQPDQTALRATPQDLLHPQAWGEAQKGMDTAGRPRDLS